MARLRGFLWLLAGLVVALLAAYVGFVTITRAADAPAKAVSNAPQVDVVVAVRALPVRTLLTKDDVQLKPIAAVSAPADAVRSIDAAVGHVTLVPMYPGETVLAPRLLNPNTVSADGRLALFITQDEVLIAVPAQDELSRSGMLKPGDKVDIMFSLDLPTERVAGSDNQNPSEEQSTFHLLQNLQIAGVRGASGQDTDPEKIAAGEAKAAQAETILLTVSPQDALVLKYAYDAGGIMNFALRAPDNDRSYTTDPVDLDYLINRYTIPIEVGK